MFINRTHDRAAIRGKYLFPYVIGEVREGRFWRPTDMAILSGNLSKDNLSNQLFGVNYRLRLVGEMLKSRNCNVECIEIAAYHGINMDVLIKTDSRKQKVWLEFESILSYCFGLEVR